MEEWAHDQYEKFDKWKMEALRGCLSLRQS